MLAYEIVFNSFFLLPLKYSVLPWFDLFLNGSMLMKDVNQPLSMDTIAQAVANNKMRIIFSFPDSNVEEEIRKGDLASALKLYPPI